MQQGPLFCAVAQDVFSQFPGYVRGVVLGFGLTNRESPEGLISLLREAEESVRQRLSPETIASHPAIVAWRETYRSFGTKPTKFRPSMEAMARRVLKNDTLPSINTIVDIGNVISLRRLVPAGGHAVDVLKGSMELRPAVGDEEFVSLDSDKPENPLPGEIIFVEGQTVLTRRWTWRQARHTLVAPSTSAVEINVDGLPPVTVVEGEGACREIADLVERFCGGQTRWEILSQDNPRILIQP